MPSNNYPVPGTSTTTAQGVARKRNRNILSNAAVPNVSRTSDNLEDAQQVCETWSRTEQYKVKGRHFWTISDFMRRASIAEVGESICSPLFPVTVEEFDGRRHDLTFELEVFPNGEEGEDNADYVAVFLTSRSSQDLDVKYDFGVRRASDGCYWNRIGNTFKHFNPSQNSWGYGKAFSKAKLAEKASELLPNGELTVVCNLEIYYAERSAGGVCNKLPQCLTDQSSSLTSNSCLAKMMTDNPIYGEYEKLLKSVDDCSTVAEDLGHQFDCQETSDLSIVCEYLFDSSPLFKTEQRVGQPCSSESSYMFHPDIKKAKLLAANPKSTSDHHVFYCHKLILAARSDVFRAMFSHRETKECQLNEILINDVDHNTLRSLLYFIYTDKLDFEWSKSLSCNIPCESSSVVSKTQGTANQSKYSKSVSASAKTSEKPSTSSFPSSSSASTSTTVVQSECVEREGTVDSLIKLLSAADKYNLDRLKVLCEIRLCKLLDITNCVTFLAVSHIHGATTLNSLAVEFVSSIFTQKLDFGGDVGFKIFSETDEWREISENFPKIVNKVLMHVASNKKR